MANRNSDKDVDWVGCVQDSLGRPLTLTMLGDFRNFSYKSSHCKSNLHKRLDTDFRALSICTMYAKSASGVTVWIEAVSVSPSALPCRSSSSVACVGSHARCPIQRSSAERMGGREGERERERERPPLMTTTAVTCT